MSEADDAEYRRRIIQILEHNGFGWVVAQAEAQIAEGKPSSKQIAEREIFSASDHPDFEIRRPSTRRASLITSEPYNEAERLEILLQAIEAALVQRSALERATLAQVRGIDAIRFEPDVPEERAESPYHGRSHELNAGRDAIALEIERDAKGALARIRRAERDGS